MLFRGTGPAWIEVRESDTTSKKIDQVGERSVSFPVQGVLSGAGRSVAIDAGAAWQAGTVHRRDRLRGLRWFTVARRSCGGPFPRPHDRRPCPHATGSAQRRTSKSWKLDTREKKIAGELIREIKSRVDFPAGCRARLSDACIAVRQRLSGGEAQRIRLAGQLGSGLCGVLYVLDEPTIGLHPRDNARLLGALHRLRDQGNTLLVVEHDRDVIRGSDYLCDFGPRAGRHGGRIVAEGPPTNVVPLGAVRDGRLHQRHQVDSRAGVTTTGAQR